MKRLCVLTLFAASAFAADWTGVISDSKCGASHSDGAASSVGCIKSCIKRGEKPVLVSSGKVLGIANTDKVPEAMYGKKVKVSGDLKDGTVTVATIAVAD